MQEKSFAKGREGEKKHSGSLQKTKFLLVKSLIDGQMNVTQREASLAPGTFLNLGLPSLNPGEQVDSWIHI